jgi:hypothetical protein
VSASRKLQGQCLATPLDRRDAAGAPVRFCRCIKSTANFESLIPTPRLRW